MGDIAEVAKTFFRGVWDMLLKTNFPGSNTSLAAILVALFLMSFSIRLFAYLTGFGLSTAHYGKVADSTDKLRSASRWQNRNKN